jgi:hypothetical protein
MAKRQLLIVSMFKALWQAPIQVLFRRFVFSVSCFAAGALTLLMAESHITPSIEQEIVALIGLIAASSGALLAFIHYIAILIRRLRG